MLGYTGDDLTNFWGLVGFGGLLVGMGLTLSNRIWRAAYFAFGGAFILCGLFWSTVKEEVPSLAPLVSRVTSNPQNWFLIVLLLIVALWLHQWRKETWAGPEWAEAGSERNAELASLRSDLAAMSALISAKPETVSPVSPVTDLTLERDLKGLLEIASCVAEIVFFKEILSQAPASTDVEWGDETENAMLEFISAVEARLIGTNYQTVYVNLMKNAGTQADKRLLLKERGYECPENREPYQFRKWVIARLQADWFKDWFATQIHDRETYIRSQRQFLIEWLAQRAKNAPSRS